MLIRLPATVRLDREGNLIFAMVGKDFIEGLCGFGDTVPDALRHLADLIEREREAPVMMPRRAEG